jgi:hypothetical protein
MLPTENVTLKNSPRNQDRAYFPLYTTLVKITRKGGAGLRRDNNLAEKIQREWTLCS